MTTSELEAGYAMARKAYGDSYADYLVSHDSELRAKDYDPKPWPSCLEGNEGA